MSHSVTPALLRTDVEVKVWKGQDWTHFNGNVIIMVFSFSQLRTEIYVISQIWPNSATNTPRKRGKSPRYYFLKGDLSVLITIQICIYTGTYLTLSHHFYIKSMLQASICHMSQMKYLAAAALKSCLVSPHLACISSHILPSGTIFGHHAWLGSYNRVQKATALA